MIYLRKAEFSDLSAIMPIIVEAKKFLSGFDTDQWQRDYPAQSDIERFIENKTGHILIVNDEVAAFGALITGEDKAYTAITDGRWSNDKFDYVAVHCLAFSDKYRGQGLSRQMFSNIFSLENAQGYRDFRVDTHPANKIMQHVFEREGFIYRGMVQYEGPRRAYQLEL
ncbi:MAG: GNAT family N-acetyltransferase [Streptococcaceae bacterium]|jgi:ribosomal protein S18 acetylase RimI-like enzyme|nr:GNAT family N-acetyltransferase [Streptococcaceae bacterium]